MFLPAGSAELKEEDEASLNPLFFSSTGSESSSALLTLPDGFNWSPLARNRAQESLPTNGVSCNNVITLLHCSVHTHVPSNRHTYRSMHKFICMQTHTHSSWAYADTEPQKCSQNPQPLRLHKPVYSVCQSWMNQTSTC